MEGGTGHYIGAQSLRELCSFVEDEPDSATVFYSSEISTSICYTESPIFNVVLRRRRMRAMESCEGQATFRIAERDFLEVIRKLVACPTWTHGQFVFSSGRPLSQDTFVPGFDDLMFEAFSLLRASPSLSTFDIQHLRFCHRHLPTLLCENPFLETLIVKSGSMDFLLLAKSIAVCFSRNSVLKSCTIVLDFCVHKLNRESLETLLCPFTTSFYREANVVLKQLVLHLPTYIDPDVHWENAIANLVRCNTTIEKLHIRFLNFGLHFNRGVCKYISRALEVNHSLKEFGCFCDTEDLKGLLSSFIPDLSGRQPNTTLSTLKLFFTCDEHAQHGKEFMDDLAIMMNDLATMLSLNSTLKHVQLSHEWGRFRVMRDGGSWNRRHVEFGTQEKLKLMLSNELRLNTSLESLAVGFWKLFRVGTEWQMSYGGPCLERHCKPAKEFIVKVKIYP